MLSWIGCEEQAVKLAANTEHATQPLRNEWSEEMENSEVGRKKKTTLISLSLESITRSCSNMSRNKQSGQT